MGGVWSSEPRSDTSGSSGPAEEEFSPSAMAVCAAFHKWGDAFHSHHEDDEEEHVQDHDSKAASVRSGNLFLYLSCNARIVNDKLVFRLPYDDSTEREWEKRSEEQLARIRFRSCASCEPALCALDRPPTRAGLEALVTRRRKGKLATRNTVLPSFPNPLLSDQMNVPGLSIGRRCIHDFSDLGLRLGFITTQCLEITSFLFRAYLFSTLRPFFGPAVRFQERQVFSECPVNDDI